MNELVAQVRHTLKGKTGVGPRLPYWLGMLLGYVADGLAKLTGKNLPVSSIRVKRFASSTEFRSSKNTLEDFEPPFQLADGIVRTLQSEFVSADPSREIFYTE
jgi:hypothetical protein